MFNDGMGNGHLVILLVGLLTAAPGVRATRGVVRFVDARTLVIVRSPQYGRELRFQLEPTTERYGEVKVGATVDVRYITKGTRSIATAVTVERVPEAPTNAGLVSAESRGAWRYRYALYRSGAPL